VFVEFKFPHETDIVRMDIHI